MIFSTLGLNSFIVPYVIVLLVIRVCWSLLDPVLVASVLSLNFFSISIYIIVVHTDITYIYSI